MRPRFPSSWWPEWLYLDWASRAPQPLPNNFVHAEWITLHDNPNFRGFVDFLRAELDQRIERAQTARPFGGFYRRLGLVAHRVDMLEPRLG
jgi:thiaminase/transcriptional activator TenA